MTDDSTPLLQAASCSTQNLEVRPDILHDIVRGLVCVVKMSPSGCFGLFFGGHVLQPVCSRRCATCYRDLQFGVEYLKRIVLWQKLQMCCMMHMVYLL